MLKNAIGLFVFTVIVLAAFLPSYTKWQDLRATNDDYKNQIAVLTAKNAKLKQEQRLLENDPAYLEKVGREKMGLIKEGEVVYKLVPIETKTTAKPKTVQKQVAGSR